METPTTDVGVKPWLSLPPAMHLSSSFTSAPWMLVSRGGMPGSLPSTVRAQASTPDSHTARPKQRTSLWPSYPMGLPA